jgi:hypothetical protein
MILTESIKEKIQELFKSTPDNIGVSYGKKVTNGKFTGEVGIVFSVERKLPLENIDENQILPSSINIDGVDYVTDVIQVGVVKTLACDSTTLNNCYGWQSSPPGNRATIRPLVGGISITSNNNSNNVGTLGFIAVDSTTQALVGVSNNHVVIGDAFYTSDRNLNGIIQNELSNGVYQNGESSETPEKYIGQVLRYVPLKLPSVGNPPYPTNQVDGALFSVTSEVISNTESFKQFGLSYTNPMPFASTAEINSLLSINPSVYSSGRTSGAKGEGLCTLVISAVGSSSFVNGYDLQNVKKPAYFTDLIEFTRTNPECLDPIDSGDSGSALIANFGGPTDPPDWKIIGLAFASSDIIAYACRIDEVAAQLGIEAWDGTAKNYIDNSFIEYITVNGASSDKTLICNTIEYWQVGLTTDSNTCV